MRKGREGRRTAGTALMRRIASRIAGAGSVEEGLAGVIPLLSRFLGADLGVFLVRRGAGWTLVGHGADEAFRRSLPRTTRVAARSTAVPWNVAAARPSGEAGDPTEIPGSVVVPVRVRRQSLGYGIFRVGVGETPSSGTLLLLDAVGAQIGAFCENVSFGERAQTDRDRLARANEELGWLLRFSESLHAVADPDAMFQCLSRELGEFAPVLGVELASLPGGPVVRVASATGAKVPARKDSRSIAREWSEALASRHGLLVPASDFRVKRFQCLAGGAEGDAWRQEPEGRTAEMPLHGAGRLVGFLAVHMPAAADGDGRVDRMVASVAGQVGLFLHKCAEREKIRSLANHDALTGLLNHLSFQDIFEREFERFRRHGRNLSLLFVDMDDFKGINDTFGHQVGDRVLGKVGGILKASLRKSDYAFRYGGDEFVVLMIETDAGRAAMLARRIQEAFRREIRGILPGEYPVSISIGISDCGSLASREREELLFRADMALYRAKSAGRDRIEVGNDRFQGPPERPALENSRFPRPPAGEAPLIQRAV